MSSCFKFAPTFFFAFDYLIVFLSSSYQPLRTRIPPIKSERYSKLNRLVIKGRYYHRVALYWSSNDRVSGAGTMMMTLLARLNVYLIVRSQFFIYKYDKLTNYFKNEYKVAWLREKEEGKFKFLDFCIMHPIIRIRLWKFLLLNWFLIHHDLFMRFFKNVSLARVIHKFAIRKRFKKTFWEYVKSLPISHRS